MCRMRDFWGWSWFRIMRQFAVVAVAILVAGCAARGVVSDEKRVVVQAWTHSMAVSFAEGECARHGRNAVLTGSSWETYIFDCREPGEMASVQVPNIPDKISEDSLPAALPPRESEVSVMRPVSPPLPRLAPKAATPPLPEIADLPERPKPKLAPAAAPPPSPQASPPPAPRRITPPPAPQASRAPSPKASGSKRDWWIQVSADRTREEALGTIRRVILKFKKLLSDYKPRIQTIRVRDVGVYYRSRFGPFSTKTAAINTCREMKRQRQACFVQGPTRRRSANSSGRSQ